MEFLLSSLSGPARHFKRRFVPPLRLALPVLSFPGKERAQML